MIYTRFGTPVKLLTCEVSEETDNRGDKFTAFWVTAEQCGVSLGRADDPDTHNIGRRILDGKQFEAMSQLRADDGWREILDACNAVRPEVFLDLTP